MATGEALRESYGELLPWLWNAARRLGVPERDLADVCHDVFVIAWERRGHFEPGRDLRAWLFGIASRVVANRRARRSGNEELPGGGFERASSETPEALVSATQTQRLIHAALSSLDADKRAVFVAHEIEAFAIPEVARALGIPLNTAYSRLRLARAAFEKAYRQAQEASP